MRAMLSDGKFIACVCQLAAENAIKLDADDAQRSLTHMHDNLANLCPF